MGRLSKRQINLANKTDTQLKIINDYFFARRFFAPYRISDRHYCDLVLEKEQTFKCFEKAIKKLALSKEELDSMDPIESLSFCYDGDYLYKNGNSSKAKYLCLFLGAKQIYAYTYTFDMASNNYNESVYEIYYNSIVAITTEEKVSEDEIDLYGFINPDGRRSIHTVFSLKLTTSGGEFKFVVQKTPALEKRISGIRNIIREKRSVRVKKTLADMPIE